MILGLMLRKILVILIDFGTILNLDDDFETILWNDFGDDFGNNFGD